MLDQDKIIRCPILTYTSVVPKDDGDTNFRTTAQKLETDIETLLTNGFTPISLREAYGSNTLDNPCVKPVCIVFLGGYENNYTVAFPILKRYNIPVSIFVATDFVGVREYPSVKGYSPHFDWKQAQEMCDSGLVEIFPLWHMFDRGKSIDELTNEHLRTMLINGETPVPNADASYNGGAFSADDNIEYMTKNTLRFSRGKRYADGTDIENSELIPAGYPTDAFPESRRHIFTHNAELFWRM